VASTYRGEDEEGYYGATVKSVIWALKDMRKDYYQELREEKEERRQEREEKRKIEKENKEAIEKGKTEIKKVN